MTARDVLLGARARVARPEHWLQGSFAQDAGWRAVGWHSPEALRFCGLAAVWAAAGRGGDVDEAKAVLRVAIAPAPSFARWNDEDERTHAEVLGAFDRAIALATRSPVMFTPRGRDLDALLGTNLRHLREDAGLTLPELARRLGLYPEQLADAEAGLERLRPDQLLAAAARLGCGADELFAEPRAERAAS